MDDCSDTIYKYLPLALKDNSAALSKKKLKNLKCKLKEYLCSSTMGVKYSNNY